MGVVVRHIDRVDGVPRLPDRASSRRSLQSALRAAALVRAQATSRLPEWFAKLQDAVALNCCKGDASGERDASQ